MRKDKPNNKKDIFLKEYSYIINELNTLREKIIINSKNRFNAIDDYLLELEEKILNDLENKKKELDNYSEKENSILDISIKLLEDVELCELKHNETKNLLLYNEEEYFDKLNRLIELINYCIINDSIEEYIKEIQLIGKLGYFDETLIDELIDLLKKFNLITISDEKIDNNIVTSFVANNLNNSGKSR